MGNWFSFGRKRKDRVTQHDKAVLDLKVQRDKLKVFQKKCETVIAREVEMARQLLADGRRKQALLCLRKKRYQEQLIEKTESQLANLQQMVDSVEFAQMEAKVLEGLKQGNAVLKEIQSQMSLDEIDALMQDTQEAVDYQNQIDTMLSGQLTELDEEAVEAEYEALQRQMEPEHRPAKTPATEAPATAAAPSAASSPVPVELTEAADQHIPAEPETEQVRLPDVPSAEPEPASPQASPEAQASRAKRPKAQPQHA